MSRSTMVRLIVARFTRVMTNSSALLELARAPSVLLAAIASGLQAGLYYGVSCGVLPGLDRGEARTYVAAMQQINVAIVNPWFLASFLGAPALAAVAAVLHLGTGGPVLVVAVLGLVFALATLVITATINVPLNTALAAAGDPDRIADLVAVREAFRIRWVSWNAARAVTSTLALASLGWASTQLRAS